MNNHVDFQINNVFANFEFTIVLVADYDLNDGEGIKNDVIFSQIYSTQLNARPFVNVGTILVEQGYVTVEADITDVNDTLTASLKMVLLENDLEVDSVLFDIESGDVVFSYPVQSNNIYNVEIYADYDLRDGEGVLYNQLLYRSVLISHERKAPTAELKDITVTTSSINLNIDVLDADGTIEAGTTIAYLYLEGVLVAQDTLVVGTNSVSFDTLLSNNNYVIMVKTDYEYDLKIDSQILVDQLLAESDILTEEKLLPGYKIDNITTESSSIEFDVDILDLSTVISWGSVHADLYHEDVLVDTTPLIVGGNFNVSFNGLLSDSSYEVIFVLDYDLEDGNGLIEDYIVGNEVFITKTNSLPTASILDSTITENSIELDILVVDSDVVVVGNTKAVLYEGDTPTGDEIALSVGVNTGITFSGIFSDTRYYVHIVTDYNLKDGKPDELAYEMYFTGYTTSSFVMMEAVFGEVIETTKDTIIFDVQVIDEDDVSTTNLQAVLYKDGIATGDTITLVVGDNVGVSFTGLESETSYKIQIESDYDLNLPTGEEFAHVLAIDYADTSKLIAPDVVFTNVRSDYDSFKVDIVVENPDDTITGGVRNAVLYKDNVATVQVVPLVDGINLDVEFTGLLANNTYEVRVIVNYDLNDVDGEQVGAEIGTVLVSTLEKFIPVVNMSDLEISRDYVSFYLNYSDVDSVLVAESLIATLYIGGIAGPSKSIETGNVTFNISGLIADFDFEIVITGDYDLDDGAGLENDGEMYRQELTTIANNLPSAVLGNVTFKQNSIDVSIEIIDVDAVLNGVLNAILYDETGAVVETIALAVGTNDVSFNHTATNNVLYTIIVEADYNLLDGIGNAIGTDREIAETIAIEYNLLRPEAVISNIVVGQDSISFDVDVYDNNGVINGSITAVLYKDGVSTGVSLPLVVGSNSKSFNTLLTNNDYEIRIITSYDNGDGNDTYANQVLADTEQTTLPKLEPDTVVVVDEILVTSIEFDIEIIDVDSTGLTYNAKLYDDQGALFATQGLLLGDNLNVLFTGLLGNEAYTLKIETTYNLTDGAGVQSGVATEVINTTQTASAPTSTINSSTLEQDSISVNLELVDSSGVTTAKTARIYKAGVLQESIGVTVSSSQDILFDELAPNTEYEVRVYATYNLNDGDGVQTDVLLTSNTYNTKSLILISDEDIGKRINSLTVTVDDPDAIITSTLITATLYEGLTPIATYIVSKNIDTVIDMINIYSGYDYSLVFSLTYDVGAGAVAGVVYTHEFTSLELEAPVIELEGSDLITMTPSIQVDVTIAEDLDSVYTGIKAELYQDGILVDTQTGLTDNATNTVTFTGYDGTDGSAYTIIIVATVDRNDGETPVEEDVASRTWINAGH